MTDLKRYLQTVWAIFRKDVQVEWRGRQGVPVMLVFSLLVVFLFNFTLQLTPQLQSGLASGLLWVTLAFAATLGLNRSASLERENDALKGLMLAPVDRSAIFFGKGLSNLLFTLLVAFILMPIISLLFSQNLLKPALILVVLLGTSAIHQPGHDSLSAEHPEPDAGCPFTHPALSSHLTNPDCSNRSQPGDSRWSNHRRTAKLDLSASGMWYPVHGSRIAAFRNNSGGIRLPKKPLLLRILDILSILLIPASLVLILFFHPRRSDHGRRAKGFLFPCSFCLGGDAQLCRGSRRRHRLSDHPGIQMGLVIPIRS